MLKCKLAVAIALLGLSGQTPAQASSAGAGAIHNVLPIQNNGPVLFNQDGTRSTPPACSTIPGRWAIDASTPGGQAKLAVLLTAYAQGRQITVYGTGICDVWVDTETVLYIQTIE
ncbi:hypothetical protein [uncultured Sphingomonas sp.]|uniref:hypothetical protein n=1 Tax=uncultured Sphingomonas sp. TaxID=158754 RepID=UPI0035CA2149